MKILKLLLVAVLLSLPFHVIANEVGCTLSSGYWKNHSECGAASSRDMTWDYLPAAEDTPFFDSGYTFCEALHVSPKGGNSYYILAHGFIAFKLNILAGAWMGPEVFDAYEAAKELFGVFTPDQVGDLTGASIIRRAFLDLAVILDDYNNGYIGPGACPDY